MTKRSARRLYYAALDSYQQGYIDGTDARISAEENGRERSPALVSGLYQRDERPAWWAGYDLGRDGQRLRADRLPLDVWVRVLANEVKPR